MKITFGKIKETPWCQVKYKKGTVLIRKDTITFPFHLWNIYQDTYLTLLSSYLRMSK